MRGITCPMCNSIEKSSRHVCRVAKKAATCSPFDESFPSSAASSSSGETRVMFCDDLIYNKLDETMGLTVRSKEKMNSVQVGDRVVTLCLLAAVCKTEMNVGTTGRVLQCLCKDLIIFKTDCGKTCYGEARDLNVLGPLPVGQKIFTTAPLILTSDDLSLKIPSNSTAVIKSFEEGTSKVTICLSRGPTCTINSTDVIPDYRVTRSSFKSLFKKFLRE